MLVIKLPPGMTAQEFEKMLNTSGCLYIPDEIKGVQFEHLTEDVFVAELHQAMAAPIDDR